MKEDEVVRIMREYLESEFPKTCAMCNRNFSTLREYILNTTPIGPAISLDADSGDWNPTKPIGFVAMANCPCGSTLALTTENMELPLRLELLSWLKIKTSKRGISPAELLEHLRDKVRDRVLKERS